MSTLLRLFSKSYRKAVSDRDYWQSQYRSKSFDLQEACRKIDDSSFKIESLKEEVGRLEKHASDLANQNSQLRKAKDAVRDSNVSLNSQYNDATNVARRLQDRIESLRKSIRETTYWATKQKGMKPEDAVDHPDHILITRLRDAIDDIDHARNDSAKGCYGNLILLIGTVKRRFGMTWHPEFIGKSVTSAINELTALIGEAARLYDSAHIALGRASRSNWEYESALVYIDDNTLWSDDVNDEDMESTIHKIINRARAYTENASKGEQNGKGSSDEAADAVPTDQDPAGERGAAGGTPGEEAPGRREASQEEASSGNQEG